MNLPTPDEMYAERKAQRLQKPLKRATVKRKQKREKNANIALVRAEVFALDGPCRITEALSWFGFKPVYRGIDPELAHKDGRGMGGNPDLSRDTPENTLMVNRPFHQGPARSMHSGHLKVRPLTGRGTRGPCCFEFYEKLPSEL